MIEQVHYRGGKLGLWSTRRLGEVLSDMPKQRPGEYKRLHDATVCPTLEALGILKTRLHDATELPPTLDALGILKDQSARAQKLSALDEETIRCARGQPSSVLEPKA